MSDYQIASVAVEKTNYGFDKLYDYVIPEGMKAAVGCRVKVSFGHGLRQGVILQLYSADKADGLKAVSQVLDEEPVLSQELVEMAQFMKEHYFCTLFDACKAMLPRGLSLKLTYSYQAVPGAPTALLSEEEQGIVQVLAARKTPVREDRLLKMLSLSNPAVLTELVRKGILLRTETVKKSFADVTVKMIRLRGEIPERKYSPQQEEVLRILTEIGEVSVKEICYFTGVTAAVTDNLVKKGICEYFEVPPPKTEPVITEPEDIREIVLTGEQQNAYQHLRQQLESGKPGVTLLYGVTGSGKTSVFMKLIDEVSAAGKGVICMVPEIALTPQMISGFAARYGRKVAVFHSGLSLGRRLDEWKRVKNGEASIAVGTRSAIFAPMENPGLIVMDEEQEYSYKSSASPRFHARELAKFRCMKNRCPLLLSSATPSMESYYHALGGRYSLEVLSSRYGTAQLPQVIVTDMNREQQQGNLSGYSSVLLEELEKNLDVGQQSILLLNRRGHNTFIACRECGKVISCPNCSISLTYHSANHRLMCHYCGFSIPAPSECPECHSRKLRYSGAGTQRAEQELQELFPKARILRLDTDSTMQRFAYEKKLGSFRSGEYDIMLGTQMVAKGLNFPDVTLVGVLSTDSMMHGDDFRSYEKTFSLLTQVVGRSGRGDTKGRAVIQTFEPGHPVIEMAAQQNYDEFYHTELPIRKTMLYPPYADIGVAAFISEEHSLAKEAAAFFSDRLKTMAQELYHDLPLRMLGPAPAMISRIGGKYRYRIIIKFKNSKRFREMMSALLHEISSNRRFADVTVWFDIDPDSVM